MTFADIPTDSEIEKAKKEHEKKKDLEGIDTSLIVAGKRSDGKDKDVGNPAKKAKLSGGSDTPKKTKHAGHKLDADEEADF